MTLTLRTPELITAEYKITTPMFLGDAFQEADAKQMRNASLKGALRFWWRALNWGRVMATNAGHESNALKTLHAEEGALFGKASDGKDSTQSLLHISSELSDCQLVSAGSPLSGLGYLLGQGLFHFKQGTLRPYISAGSLRLEVRLKPSTDKAQIASVQQALIALGLFGGLGSRARKGFGSLALQWLEHNQTRQTFTNLDYVQHVIDGLDFSAPDDAPLSALTRSCRLDVSLTGNRPVNLLEEISKEQQLYRSYGKDGKVGREDARRNFKLDHDNVLDAIRGKQLTALPQRAVFGLPHNYHYSSGGDMNISTEGDGRRTSPLFIHIHEFSDGKCVAIQLLLPGRFLPAKVAVELKNPRDRRQKTQLLNNPEVNYQVIHAYLDGFKNRKELRNGR